jgi:hypothetical protein
MKADNFLTLIYKINAGCLRLLCIGKWRTEKTLRQGLMELGPTVLKGLRFGYSYRWKPYLDVLAVEAAAS